MSKGKFGSKWKSAAGEIIYIFIGITLAIMFQNWNDNRKEQQQVKKLLVALLAENQANLNTLPGTIALTESVLDAANSMMGLMGVDYQSKDAYLVDSLLSQYILTPKYLANEEVIREITESKILENIKDDSIRRSIIQWSFLKEQSKVLENMNFNQNQNLIMPYLSQKVSILAMDHRFGVSGKSLPPTAFKIDNRKILADFRFENLLEMQFYSMTYQHEMQKELLTLMQKMDVQLNKHLK